LYSEVFEIGLYFTRWITKIFKVVTNDIIVLKVNCHVVLGLKPNTVSIYKFKEARIIDYETRRDVIKDDVNKIRKKETPEGFADVLFHLALMGRRIVRCCEIL
jgi:hypothetical protein